MLTSKTGPAASSASNPALSPIKMLLAAMQQACTEANLDKLRELIASPGVSIDVSDRSDGLQIIHLAALGCQLSVMKWLVKHGAKVDAVTLQGSHPLHFACKEGQNDIVQFLLENGEQVECAERDGLQPMHIAAQTHQDSTLLLLLAKGASIEARSKRGVTPLHYAAQRGHDSTVRLLLDKGARVDVTDLQGFQPLHLAAQFGNSSTVELLLASGAQVDARNAAGHTPLHTAFKDGAMVRLLMDHGAKLFAPGALDIFSLFHIAPHPKLASFFLEKGLLEMVQLASATLAVAAPSGVNNVDPSGSASPGLPDASAITAAQCIQLSVQLTPYRPLLQHLYEFCKCCGTSGMAKKLVLCSSCRLVYYCGTECQRRDWKTVEKGGTWHGASCKTLYKTLKELTLATSPEQLLKLSPEPEREDTKEGASKWVKARNLHSPVEE